MYKIKEIASLIGVETIEIHKKLLTLSNELKGHTFKENGVIVVDDKALNIIEKSFIKISDLDVNPTSDKNELNFNINDNMYGDFVIEDSQHDLNDKDEPSEVSIDDLQGEINKLKKYLMVLDDEINRERENLQQNARLLSESTHKLKVIEKEFYNKVVRR